MQCRFMLASTLILTNTVYATATVTEDATETDTVFATATDYIDVTATETTSVTETVQSTQYPASETLVKRQQTVVPSAIPSYASVCSGAVRYASACSCVGATRTTITVAGETTTVYTDKTITDSTSTVTVTAATEAVTITDSTITLQTTVATSTSTTVVATVTNVTYIPLADRFAIQVQEAPFTGQYLAKRAGILAIAPPSSNPPTIFSLTNGNIYNGGEAISTLGGWLATYKSSPVVFPSSRSATTYDTISSSIDAGDVNFHLQDASSTVGKIWVCHEQDWGTDNGVAFTAPSLTSLRFDNYCSIITLKAVPVPF
ncbi:hypothetical protein ABW20_dc0100997 [Dactylellina cionopaga]|nr:hypothetical protein ABW20_dc0100997 [Dactylellina cionopaga]